MNFAQLPIFPVSMAFYKTLRILFSNSVALTTSILSRAPLSAEPVVPYVFFLDYIANVSLINLLALYWIIFLSAPAARSCQVREGILQLLTTLLGVVRKAFLLVFQRTSFTAALLLFLATILPSRFQPLSLRHCTDSYHVLP